MAYIEFGYLELSYLEEYPYLQAVAEETTGFQTQIIINDDQHVGHQSQFTINDSENVGLQSQFIINDDEHVGHQVHTTIDTTTPVGFQSQFGLNATNNVGFQTQFIINDDAHVSFQTAVTINDDSHVGNQAQVVINDSENVGLQSQFIINDDVHIGTQSQFSLQDDQHVGFQTAITVNATRHLGFEANLTKHRWRPCEYYLADSYLTGPYLVYCHEYLIGVQTAITNNKDYHQGFQSQFVINDDQHVGLQSRFVIDKSINVGHQANFVAVQKVGFQTRIIIYNTTNLRVLCDFSSRGSETTGGTNAWGNPIGTGQNWVATSTQASATNDFSVYNLNTDIVEQYWRSATGVTTVNLDCDTERVQGIGLDTFGMLNHNITTTAIITLQGANNSGFSPTGITINIENTVENTYYISPLLPTSQFRYWRLSISDTTNPDTYLRIGTIVFGDAIIFNGANFKNPISFRKVHFSDGVFTEGFTNVFNDRGIKKTLKLDFENIGINSGNYINLAEIFDHDRTNLKCLWIPTPQYPGRYAVFSKLVELPEETHNDLGEDADYVSLSVNLDESR